MDHLFEGNSYFTKVHTCRFFQETSEEIAKKILGNYRPIK